MLQVGAEHSANGTNDGGGAVVVGGPVVVVVVVVIHATAKQSSTETKAAWAAGSVKLLAPQYSRQAASQRWLGSSSESSTQANTAVHSE